MRNYELTLILDSQLPEDQQNNRVQKVTALIASRGGEIVHVERWGLRKLAYEIGKRQQGFYTLVQFRSNGDLIRELEQMCRLDEGIIRHMAVVRKKFVTREEAIRQEAPDRPRAPVTDVSEKSREDADEQGAEEEEEEETP